MPLLLKRRKYGRGFSKEAYASPRKTGETSDSCKRIVLIVLAALAFFIQMTPTVRINSKRSGFEEQTKPELNLQFFDKQTEVSPEKVFGGNTSVSTTYKDTGTPNVEKVSDQLEDSDAPRKLELVTNVGEAQNDTNILLQKEEDERTLKPSTLEQPEAAGEQNQTESSSISIGKANDGVYTKAYDKDQTRDQTTQELVRSRLVRERGGKIVRTAALSILHNMLQPSPPPPPPRPVASQLLQNTTTLEGKKGNQKGKKNSGNIHTGTSSRSQEEENRELNPNDLRLGLASTVTSSTGKTSLSCKPISNRLLVSSDGDIEEAVLLNSTVETVYDFNNLWRYMHMVTSAKYNNQVIIAFQAAPAPPADPLGKVEAVVEGLQQQTILWMHSAHQGSAFSPPSEPPLKRRGAVWSPVLFADEPKQTLWLFYTESNRCLRPTTPPTWEPGGDIKMIRWFGPIFGGSGHWSEPVTLLKQERGGVPNVIANRLVKTDGREWVLPYWQEYTHRKTTAEMEMNMVAARSQSSGGGGKIEERAANAVTAMQDFCLAKEFVKRMMQTPETPEGSDLRYSSPGALFSPDQGHTWKFTESLSSPHATLLEGALVALQGGRKPTKQQSQNQAAGGAGGKDAGLRTRRWMLEYQSGFGSAKPEKQTAPKEGGGGYDGDDKGGLGRRRLHNSQDIMQNVMAEIEAMRIAEAKSSDENREGISIGEAVSGAANAVVQSPLMMMLRSDKGCLFRTYSANSNQQTKWLNPEAIEVVNPNSKVDILRLSSTGHLVMAFNNHPKTLPYCNKCRTHLHLAFSNDDGVTWKLVAQLENEERDGVRVHYPSLLELDADTLLVFYSRFYLGACGPGLKAGGKDAYCLPRDSSKQGIFMATVDLKAVRQGQIPQLDETPISKNHTKDAVLKEFLTQHIMVRVGKVLTDTPKRLMAASIARLEDKMRWSPSNSKRNQDNWIKITEQLAETYDVSKLGGHELRRRPHLLKHMHTTLQAMLVNQSFKQPAGQLKAGTFGIGT